MNLFILSQDFSENARFHVDRHVVKIIVEAAQVASNVFWSFGETGPYKKTHINHPISKWCRESLENYLWTVRYGLTLCEEYTHRYGKIHATQSKLEYMSQNFPQGFNKTEQTPFVLAMPDEYQCSCPVQSYRKYYLSEKQHLFKWTKRSVPEWI